LVPSPTITLFSVFLSFLALDYSFHLTSFLPKCAIFFIPPYSRSRPPVLCTVLVAIAFSVHGAPPDSIPFTANLAQSCPHELVPQTCWFSPPVIFRRVDCNFEFYFSLSSNFFCACGSFLPGPLSTPTKLFLPALVPLAIRLTAYETKPREPFLQKN